MKRKMGGAEECIITKMLREMQERTKSNIKGKHVGKSKYKTIIVMSHEI